MDLKNKTVVLTGASGGIGQAIAKRIDQQDGILFLVGRDKEKLESFNSTLTNKHIIVCADLSTEAGRKSLLKECQKSENGIDVLINNAGISQFDFLESQHNIDAMININLTAPITVCQLLLPLLKKSHQSIIVNVGSTFGSIGYPGFSVYCASKFGLRGFSQCLARELKNTTVKVLYIAPRATKTEINDRRVVAMNKQLGNAMDDVSEVAENIVRAINKNKNSEIYLGWPEKFFVKLNALFPDFVSKNLEKDLSVIYQYSEQKI